MAKVTGFLEHDRQENSSISPESRIKNFREFIIPFSESRSLQDFINKLTSETCSITSIFKITSYLVFFSAKSSTVLTIYLIGRLFASECADAVLIFFSTISIPVTLAPNFDIGSHNKPPPQPTSKSFILLKGFLFLGLILKFAKF